MKHILKMGLAVFIIVWGAVFPFPASAGEVDGSAGNTAADVKRFDRNITLDGILLSDYTYPLAQQALTHRVQRFLKDFELRVIVNDKDYYLNADEISFEFNTMYVFNQLWFGSLADIGGVNAFFSEYSYDKAKVEAFAEAIVRDLQATVPPVKNTGPVFNPQTRTFSDGPSAGRIIGYDLNSEAFLSQIPKRHQHRRCDGE